MTHPNFAIAQPQRRVVWLGDSKRRLRDFPRAARKLLGDELQLIQFGGMPRDAKPFKGYWQRCCRDCATTRLGSLPRSGGATNRKAYLCFARLPEKIEEWHRNPEAGR